MRRQWLPRMFCRSIHVRRGQRSWQAANCCARLVSSSSNRNSNCSICRSNFSDLHPNFMRRSLAISSFSRSSLARPVALLWKQVVRAARRSTLSKLQGLAYRDQEGSRDVSSCAQYARNFFPCKKKVHQNKKISKKIAQRETVTIYTANCGVCVRTGRRQSIPSSNIDSCAGVKDTVPLVACGQTNLPLSSLFEKRHSPSPSNHNTLIKSPRLPRKIYTWPENGLS